MKALDHEIKVRGMVDTSNKDEHKKMLNPDFNVAILIAKNQVVMIKKEMFV